MKEIKLDKTRKNVGLLIDKELQELINSYTKKHPYVTFSGLCCAALVHYLKEKTTKRAKNTDSETGDCQSEL